MVRTAADSVTVDSLGGPVAADSLHPIRLAVVATISTGAFVAGHLLQTDIWWKGEKSAFHFNWSDDWRYALGADKLGHAFFPYMAAGVYDDVFRWCGVDSTTSIWTAGGLALGYQTWVEIRDGFSAEWGFSWGDETADILGAGLQVAAHRWPALDAIRLKASYWPSERFRAGSNRVIIDDYESSYYWVSVDVHSLLPPKAAPYWPAWLDLAIGHSVRGLDDQGGGEHRLYIALDLDVRGLPIHGWLWRLLTTPFEYYHLPAPTISLLPSIRLHLLRP